MGFTVPPAKKANTALTTPNTANNDGFLMDLPSQIILEILTRLPVGTIINCKSVCKQWHALITHPYFSSLHFSRARRGLVVRHSEIFKKFFQIIDLDDGHNAAGDHLPHSTMLQFNVANISAFSDADVVVDGSADGLLFLRDINYKHETLYVCNPVTRQYATLPPPRRTVRYPSVVTHGFGATAAGEYKVVRVFHERILDPDTRACLAVPFSECQVYTVGTGAWRTVVAATPFAYDSCCVGLFLRGNIHWLIKDLSGLELISCFDLERETFTPFPPPFPARRILGSLGVLRGCLCLCDNSSHSDIEIWVMKEYGVEKSWSKEIVIKKIDKLTGPSFHVVRVLRAFGDGQLLLMWGDFFMFYYCTKTKVVRGVDVHQPVGPNSIEAMDYAPTFLSLQKFVKENVNVF
ncbi:F-box protein At3g07870-like [Andrographis paniculata]|uniref:F-box protein At3g07870-like n=1 Tax=Andrographis paniculata TaxID=175694 RepID=UPI0021E81F83|nr:F-box protein At3g07870-like [Andrographis paniculata]